MTRIRIQTGEEFHTPESVDDVCKTFRQSLVCPAFNAKGRTTYLVWNHVLFVAPEEALRGDTGPAAAA